MFDIGYSELLVIAVVALIVIGPKDLPRVMRTVGQWVGRARGMARHFRSGVDTMIREAELEEMEKKWREENDRIMRDHPMVAGWDAAAPLPAPDGPQGEARTALPEAEPEPEIGEDDRRPLPAPPARQPGEPLP
ncbi:MAG TPA: Sec-independent protein translocase protein TatB [Allosphingosinicella sp.]|jgi:sec-independent protein translocase protein TatB